MRVNALCRYRDNGINSLHSLHVLDKLMENFNMWTKVLPSGADQVSLTLHIQNVMVARNSLNCVHYCSSEISTLSNR